MKFSEFRQKLEELDPPDDWKGEVIIQIRIGKRTVLVEVGDLEIDSDGDLIIFPAGNR